jgi:hypothetical protein
MSSIMYYCTCNKKTDIPLRVDFGTPAYSSTLSTIYFVYDIPGGFSFIYLFSLCMCVSIGTGFEEEFSTFSL